MYFKFLIILLVLSIFTSCKDKSYLETIYNKKQLQDKISCLKLDIEPYSKDIFNSSKVLYHFNKNCDYSLKIRYKSDIVCNSPYSTNRSFHSFIELSLSYKNRLFYSVYKDLKDNSTIKQEINQIYNNFIIDKIKKVN